jgi:hypothetical protein
MNRFLKILLIWMLAFALPAQAMGSVIKLSCGPTHHLAAPAPVDAVEHVHHEMGHDAAHHHELAGDGVHGDAADSSDAQEKFGSGTCSACATCCASAVAVHSELNWKPGFRSSFILVHSPVLSFTGHVPAGLERPPRFFLV